MPPVQNIPVQTTLAPTSDSRSLERDAAAGPLPATPPERRTRAALFMLAASACFAGMTTSVRFGCARLPALESVCIRGLLDSLIIVPILIHKGVPLLGNNRRELLLRGTYGTMGVACLFTSILRIPVADATALFRSSALFMPFVARLVIKEPLKRSRVVLSSLGFVGALLILKPGAGVASYAGLIALSGALFNCLAFVSIRHLSGREHPLTIMLAFLLLSSIYSFLVAGRSFILPHGGEWAALAAIAVLGLVGQYFVTLSFASAPASVVTPWNYFEIVFAAFFGAFLLAQSPDLLSIAGMATLAVAAILISRT